MVDDEFEIVYKIRLYFQWSYCHRTYVIILYAISLLGQLEIMGKSLPCLWITKHTVWSSHDLLTLPARQSWVWISVYWEDCCLHEWSMMVLFRWMALKSMGHLFSHLCFMDVSAQCDLNCNKHSFKKKLIIGKSTPTNRYRCVYEKKSTIVRTFFSSP